MISEPGSAPTADAAAQAQGGADHGPLTDQELYQLTLYKWRYSLEAYGFAADEVRELMFLKWLHLSRRLLP